MDLSVNDDACGRLANSVPAQMDNFGTLVLLNKHHYMDEAQNSLTVYHMEHSRDEAYWGH